MQTIADISVSASECSKELFQGLVALYPDKSNQYIFNCELPVEHPITKSVIDLLAAHGWEPNKPCKERRKNTEFHLKYLREYDDTDYQQARHLEPVPLATIGLSMRRSKSDRLLLKRSTARSKITLAAADWAWLVVSDKVRRLMIEAGLRHVIFKEVETAAPIPEELRNQIWELSSDLTLPPLSPMCELVTTPGGLPFTGDRQKGGFAHVEGLYAWPEYHYTESAIRSVEPFDLAHTFERHHHDTPQPKFVASQRFYQFCKTHGIKMKWVPVHIDPD